MPEPELDHVFIAVSQGGAEADRISAAGFAEGAPNIHRGQGTACRRFFFENAYLELIWLENPAEATTATIEPTGLALRAGGAPGVSRIGVCLRLPHDEIDKLPVATWPYTPPYLPPGGVIPIAMNSSMRHEPLLFFLPMIEPRRFPASRHANGAKIMTQVRVTVHGQRGLSPELEWLRASEVVRIESGEREALAIELDHGVQHGTCELTGLTPLILTW